VPRLVTRIRDWGDTALRLPKIRARHVFTGKVHDLADNARVGELFAGFPVALLIAER
jgi:maltooligosyltrehalose synthase